MPVRRPAAFLAKVTDSVAFQVTPRRPLALRVHTRAERTMRVSTVFPDALFGPLLANRTRERDVGRDHGGKQQSIMFLPIPNRYQGFHDFGRRKDIHEM